MPGQEKIDSVTMGRFTAKRWAGFLKQFTDAREKTGGDRFIDISYETLTKTPLVEARRVMERLHVPMSADVEAAST